MELTAQHAKTYLQRIANILMINGGFLESPGLYSGEMGLVLFFFRYARFTQNGLFAEYSFDLIQTIQNRIHAETPINYKAGITGIGATFEYLVQNGFVEADTDDILEEFDRQIFSLQNLPCLPLDELLGIGYYAFWRMSGNSSHKDEILKTMSQVVNFMEEKSKDLPAVHFFKNIVTTETRFDFHDLSKKPHWRHLCCKNSPYLLESDMYSRLLEQFLKDDSFEKNAFDQGIYNGLAGLGLALLTELEGDDSWTSLFQPLFSATNFTNLHE